MSKTYYLMQFFAPTKETEVLVLTSQELDDAFTDEQRVLLAEGARILHIWKRGGRQYAICDMGVTTLQKWS